MYEYVVKVYNYMYGDIFKFIIVFIFGEEERVLVLGIVG